MTARNLFSIILKVLALFFIRDFFAMLPQLFTLISMSGYGEFMNEETGFISPIIATILSIGAYGLMAYALLFRTEWVVDTLRMEKGFSKEPLPLSIHRSTVLTIAVIIVGALLVLNAIPVLLAQLVLYVQFFRSETDNMMNPYGPDNTETIINTAELLLGLLILGYQREIVNYIEYRSRKKRKVDNKSGHEVE